MSSASISRASVKTASWFPASGVSVKTSHVTNRKVGTRRTLRTRRSATRAGRPARAMLKLELGRLDAAALPGGQEAGSDDQERDSGERRCAACRGDEAVAAGAG